MASLDFVDVINGVTFPQNLGGGQGNNKELLSQMTLSFPYEDPGCHLAYIYLRLGIYNDNVVQVWGLLTVKLHTVVAIKQETFTSSSYLPYCNLMHCFPFLACDIVVKKKTW